MPDAELVERLKRLERHNRRMTRVLFGALVAALAFTSIYAGRPAPMRVTAHSLELVDGSGKVRITMGIDQGMPTILMSDAQGVPHMGMYLNKSGWPIVWLAGTVDSYNIPAPVRELASMQASIRLMVDPSSGEPTLTFSDPQGFRMDLGRAETGTATGAIEHTSAASITMFANDRRHRVIWRAP